MKLFDCFMYNNEDLILELRFNTLINVVHKFIIVESAFDHQGNKKKFNFKINKFKKFQHKIKYLKITKFPENLSDWERENYNRNYIKEGIIEAAPNDLIMISDVDEIPSINSLDILKERKFTVFRQKMIYYRFNLKNITEPYWFGSKVCKKKYLRSPQWLRNQKVKSYPFWRIDKINWNIIKNGGWHFTRIISPEEIHNKELDTEHHDEYRASKKNPEKIRDFIKRRVIDHDHLADSRENKFGKEFPLKQLDINEIPKYIRENQIKYSNWLDFN